MSEILNAMEEKPAWFDRIFPDGHERVGETDFEQHYYEAKTVRVIKKQIRGHSMTL